MQACAIAILYTDDLRFSSRTLHLFPDILCIICLHRVLGDSSRLHHCVGLVQGLAIIGGYGRVCLGQLYLGSFLAHCDDEIELNNLSKAPLRLNNGRLVCTLQSSAPSTTA